MMNYNIIINKNVECQELDLCKHVKKLIHLLEKKISNLNVSVIKLSTELYSLVSKEDCVNYKIIHDPFLRAGDCFIGNDKMINNETSDPPKVAILKVKNIPTFKITELCDQK